MPHYRVDSATSKVVVRARSSIHDTSTTWSKVSGSIEVDPEAIETAGASASFTVDMTAFDAGDWLKNRKLRKDLAVEQHPSASFELSNLREVVRTDGGRFRAVADGVLSWRGRDVRLAIAGEGVIDPAHIDAYGRFDLDIRQLGIEPPRFLMFKVESEVTVEVTLRARAS